MPLLAAGGQDMTYRSGYALLAVFGQPQAESNFIGRKETDAVKITGQPIRVLTDYLDRLIAIFFIDPHRKKGRDAMPLQKHHHFPHHLMLPPGLFDHLQLFLGNTGNLEQPADIVFKDIQGMFLEVPDNPGRGFRPDAMDQSRTQVFFQCGGGRRFSSQWPVGL